MIAKKPHQSIRLAGFTLVELLIALTIASALTAIALPTLKDGMRQNTLSRSASLVKGAFINARAQAIRTGRPYGIVIERQRRKIGSGTADNLDFAIANYATRMYYVQSPLEYRGDVQFSSAVPFLQDLTPGNTADAVTPRFFFPEASAGILAASARNQNSPARRLIGIGTPFSVAGSGYVFDVTGLTYLTNTNGLFPGVPGTVVDFNFAVASPRNSISPGSLNTSVATSTFPNALADRQRYDFKFRVNPIRAPLAPVSLIGKTVIDLSISGPASDPLAFNAQEIVDQDPASNIPPLVGDPALNDIVVMFAPDGRLDGVYTDQRIVQGSNIVGFSSVRLDPSTIVSFNVGFVDGLLDNIDDGARYPDLVGTTDYQVNPGDPVPSPPGTGLPLDPRKVPNYANSDCAWISVMPSSGAIRLDSVASQRPAGILTNYYGFSATPTARNVMNARVHLSRRLTTGGAFE